MKFVDSIRIRVRGGRGGDGIASFMCAKGRPKLGPDGGDGGKGGSVYLLGNPQLNTLSALRFRALYRAEDGERGGSNNCRGACGEDLIIPVPLGTVVKDADTGAILGEVVEDGQRVLVARGGRHGLGNIHWASSTHQIPDEFRPGGPGEERELSMELKLIADVGLAGFPNAGKSTLLSVVSAARPKIADYPFTTLVPNLGVVDCSEPGDFSGRAIVMADVPGLIEGASEGRGLGHQFLKHLERTAVIVFLLDGAALEQEPAVALGVLREELVRFSPELAGRRAIAVINKIDAMDDVALDQARKAVEASGLETLTVSAVARLGLESLKRRLWEMVAEERQRAAALAAEERQRSAFDEPYWAAVPASDAARIPVQGEPVLQ